MENCKLCSQKKPLLRKSHIIPDFMYKELFDHQHKIYYFKPFKLETKENYMKRPSSGEYEGGILCKECDTKIIGKFECYANEILYGTNLKPEINPIFEKRRTHEGIIINHIKNVDYKKFKLFLLSILWRASISTRPFFREIALDKNEEIIRKMIYEGTPGNIHEFPIFVSTCLNDENQSSDIIAQPQKIELKENPAYVFLIGGLFYTFLIPTNKVNIPQYILAHTIRPSNEFEIVEFPLSETKDIMRNFGL